MERQSKLPKPSSQAYASTITALHNNKKPPQKLTKQKTGQTQVLGLNQAS
jgi:hypothetical protein